MWVTAVFAQVYDSHLEAVVAVDYSLGQLKNASRILKICATLCGTGAAQRAFSLTTGAIWR